MSGLAKMVEERGIRKLKSPENWILNKMNEDMEEGLENLKEERM